MGVRDLSADCFVYEFSLCGTLGKKATGSKMVACGCCCLFAVCLLFVFACFVALALLCCCWHLLQNPDGRDSTASLPADVLLFVIDLWPPALGAATMAASLALFAGLAAGSIPRSRPNAVLASALVSARAPNSATLL